MHYSQENAPFFAGLFLIFSLAAPLLVAYWQGDPIDFRQSGESQEVLGVSKQVDPRIKYLTNFLENQRSPLVSQAAIFIEVADKYGLNWRLLPAIAGAESSFGKVIPPNKQNGENSYNAFGWGVYGQKVSAFSSWEEGIKKVGEGLRKEYINKGSLTLKEIRRFYARDSSWARDVAFFMNQIGLEEEENESENRSL